MNAALQRTSDDALISKLSAHNKGYLDDPFLRHFLSWSEFRSPIINRGYWARFRSMRMKIAEYAKVHPQFQVINFGCGLDTLGLHVVDTYEGASYIEIDFHETIMRKTQVLRRRFKDWMGERRCQETLLNGILPETYESPRYQTIACDLRETDTLRRRINEVDWFQDVPTLCVFECILVYLPAEIGDTLIAMASNLSTCASCLVYEQCSPGDKFGSEMVRNMALRSCPLKSLEKYPEISDQIERYQKSGFSVVNAANMLTVFNEQLEAEERQRVSKLEPLDELEEWELIMSHYFLLEAHTKDLENVDDQDQSPSKFVL